MNCKERVFKGAVPYSMNTYVKQSEYIVPEEEMRYVKYQCKKWEEKCHCGQHMGNYTNLLDEQHVLVKTARAATEAGVIAALQSGPVTTCFKSKKGAQCTSSCEHA